MRNIVLSNNNRGYMWILRDLIWVIFFESNRDVIITYQAVCAIYRFFGAILRLEAEELGESGDKFAVGKPGRGKSVGIQTLKSF